MSLHSREPHAPAAGEIAKFEPRKLSIVQAAYKIIEKDGFENLRTRAVAQMVGINVATLHYYFPSKQDLIAATALYLASKFETLHAAPAPESSLERLRQEFADAAHYLSDTPGMIDVMRELIGRSRRDPHVARITAPMKTAWQATIEEIIRDGVADGTFTPAISPGHAAAVIVALLWGVATFPMDMRVLEQARLAIEQWLIAPLSKRRRK